MIVFLISGKKGSGKNTFSVYAQRQLRKAGFNPKRVGEVSYALALRRFCVKYLGLTNKQVFGGQKSKDDVIGTFGDFFNEELVTSWNRLPTDPISLRTLLQYVGTEVFRKQFHRDFWLRQLVRDITRRAQRGYQVLFVTDARFRNEIFDLGSQASQLADKDDPVPARDIEFKTVRLVRPAVEGTVVDAHESEISLDHLPPNSYDFYAGPEQLPNRAGLRSFVQEVLVQTGLIPDLSAPAEQSASPVEPAAV